MDFEINSKATLNLLLLAKKYSLKNPFIYFSTNKVYGDKINYENFIEKKNRYEISKKNKYYENGVDENLSVDKSMHSIFWVFKIISRYNGARIWEVISNKTVLF